MVDALHGEFPEGYGYPVTVSAVNKRFVVYWKRTRKKGKRKMKRKLCSVLVAILLCISMVPAFPVQAQARLEAQNGDGYEMRGLWISFLDWQTYLKGYDEAGFRLQFRNMCQNSVAQGINSLFVHVRSHNDAVYPSAIYPWSEEMLGGNPGYDPMPIMLEEAHALGLQFHAWINPYGYRNGKLSGDPAIVTGDNIVAGVEELLTNYPEIDGIHFDDYFIPADKAVHNTLIAAVYQVSHNHGKVFGISPAGSVESNTRIGADVTTWLSVPGYIDYICPQIYWTDHYGKTGTTPMFSQRAIQWTQLNTLNLPMYMGLATFYCGYGNSTDPGWKMASTNLLQQVGVTRGLGWDGYIQFRYEYFVDPVTAPERILLDQILH